MIEWEEKELGTHTLWNSDGYYIRKAAPHRKGFRDWDKYRVFVAMQTGDHIVAFDSLEEAKRWCEAHYLTGA